MSPAPFRPVCTRLRANTMSTTTVALGAGFVGLGAYALWLRRSTAAQAIEGAAPLDQQTGGSTKGVFSGFGFHKLKLHSSELVNHNTKRLRFELPNPSQPSGLGLSSALLTLSFPNGGWVPCLRPYTPVNDLNEPGYVELLVKKYPNGKQSTHLHSMQPGDTLTFAPIKAFAWTPNKHAHVALIAGGAGITPMYQLARGILSNPHDQTRITLVWGVNGDDDLFLKEQFVELERTHPGRFQARYVVSRPSAGSPYPQGYVDRKFLEAAGLSPYDEKNVDTKVFVSGPPPMEKALVGAKGWAKTPGVLKEMGYQPGQIHQF